EIGVLGPDAFADTVRLDLARVYATGNIPVIGARFAKTRRQELKGLPCLIGAGQNTMRLHPRRCRRTDAVKATDGQAMDKLGSSLRRDYEQPVRFALVRGQLGEKLVIADPGRGGQPCRLADTCADLLRDARRGAAVQIIGEIQIS